MRAACTQSIQACSTSVANNFSSSTHWHAMLMRSAPATGTYPSADTVITTAGFPPRTGPRPVNQYAAQTAAVHGRLGAQQCHVHTQSPPTNTLVTPSGVSGPLICHVAHHNKIKIYSCQHLLQKNFQCFSCTFCLPHKKRAPQRSWRDGKPCTVQLQVGAAINTAHPAATPVAGVPMLA